MTDNIQKLKEIGIKVNNEIAFSRLLVTGYTLFEGVKIEEEGLFQNDTRVIICDSSVTKPIVRIEEVISNRKYFDIELNRYSFSSSKEKPKIQICLYDKEEYSKQLLSGASFKAVGLDKEEQLLQGDVVEIIFVASNDKLIARIKNVKPSVGKFVDMKVKTISYS